MWQFLWLHQSFGQTWIVCRVPFLLEWCNPHGKTLGIYASKKQLWEPVFFSRNRQFAHMSLKCLLKKHVHLIYLVTYRAHFLTDSNTTRRCGSNRRIQIIYGKSLLICKLGLFLDDRDDIWSSKYDCNKRKLWSVKLLWSLDKAVYFAEIIKSTYIKCYRNTVSGCNCKM